MHDVRRISMEGGKATGVSVKWDGGRFCFIAADRGIIGCGIFNIKVFDEFKMAGALMKGTPECPYVEPEDLLNGKVTMISKAAAKLGITKGMTGKRVLKLLIQPR